MDIDIAFEGRNNIARIQREWSPKDLVVEIASFLNKVNRAKFHQDNDML